MPSPFPGMDPYIEHSTIWSDFHGGLAEAIRAELNAVIQPNYVARMTPYVTYDVIEVTQVRHVSPDVSVWQSQPAGTMTLEAPVITPAPVQSAVALEVPLRLFTVEIRMVGGLQLVTAVEILSPVNKRPGHEAYQSYLRKRRELLRSEAHLLEIDLLRAGTRPPLETPVPPAPYYVTLSRADRRPHVDVWPIQLADKLPVLPVPLLEPDPDVPLDLGKIVTAVYERGGYASIIDYRQPPPAPKLAETEDKWIAELLAKTGRRL